MKELDRKLTRIRAGEYTPRDFILADAKDADMSLGLMAPGPSREPAGLTPTGAGRESPGLTARGPTGEPAGPSALAGREPGAASAPGPSRGEPGDCRFLPRAVYLAAMRETAASGLVDILLASASSIEILAAGGTFDRTGVTPAVRCNDATDIWVARGGRYRESTPQPFRTADLRAVRRHADLGLYSITFANDAAADVRTLEAYAAFRAEASALELRHILEVFNPPASAGLPPDAVGPFVNDSLTRSLAGVLSSEQPVFLKVAYDGRRALEELAAYDPGRLIVGVLGGAKGTTRDTFELLARAERAGARAALFGRKINYAEDPIALLTLMRRVIEGDLSPGEAVRRYHEGLRSRGLPATLALEDDVAITDPALAGEGD